MKSCLRRRRSNVQDVLADNNASVSFNLDKTTFREVEHLNEMSVEHIEAVWYSHEDYDEIKETIKPIIRDMMKNNGRVPEESDDYTSRGLGTIKIFLPLRNGRKCAFEPHLTSTLFLSPIQRMSNKTRVALKSSDKTQRNTKCARRARYSTR